MTWCIEVLDEEKEIRFKNQPITPIICDVDHITKDCNAVRIVLNATLDADLKWEKEKEEALKYRDQGYLLFWELNMGLFQDLALPVFNKTQYLSLGIAIDYFNEFLWNDFEESTLGLSFYRGKLDFKESFSWDSTQKNNFKGWLIDTFSTAEAFQKKLHLDVNWMQVTHQDLKATEEGQKILSFYCRDVATDYFDLLAARFPDNIQLFNFYDVTELKSNIHLYQLLEKKSLENVHIVINENRGPSSLLTFSNKNSKTELLYSSKNRAAKIAILLSSELVIKNNDLKKLDAVHKQLEEKALLYKFVYEESMHHSWEGLDYIIFSPCYLSEDGKRKLSGFCASGGQAVTISRFVGLSEEITFDKMLDDLLKN